MTSCGIKIRFLISINPKIPTKGKATEAANQDRVMGEMFKNQSPKSDIFLYDTCWHKRSTLKNELIYLPEKQLLSLKQIRSSA